MLLVIDVGNTNTVFSLSENGAWQRVWRIETRRGASAEAWWEAMSGTPDTIDQVALCSVVPAASIQLSALCTERLGIVPLIVTSDLRLNVKLGTAFPDRVGADRIANAVAARAQTTGAALVVDLGTATKIEAISAEGVFLGGAIAPGLEAMLEALVGRAAKLNSVPIALPPAAIGRDTTTAMQSGLVLGHFEMIRALIADMAHEMGDVEPDVFVTGGHIENTASPFRALGKPVPTLTIDGVRAIAELNGDR